MPLTISSHPVGGKTLAGLRNNYVLECAAQSRTEQTYSQIYKCIIKGGSPAEIQTGTQWNLIGRSMTAPSPVSSPSSILLPPPSQSAFIPERKNIVPV